jgi:hypothetical protein
VKDKKVKTRTLVLDRLHILLLETERSCDLLLGGLEWKSSNKESPRVNWFVGVVSFVNERHAYCTPRDDDGFNSMVLHSGLRSFGALERNKSKFCAPGADFFILNSGCSGQLSLGHRRP